MPLFERPAVDLPTQKSIINDTCQGLFPAQSSLQYAAPLTDSTCDGNCRLSGVLDHFNERRLRSFTKSARSLLPLTTDQYYIMATSMASPSPLDEGKPNFTMPMPPPLLHTRSGNQIYEAPQTPTMAGFTSPFSTPQGSPSKSKLPPGANELPDAFDNAMRLDSGSPTKVGRQQLSPHSPNKSARHTFDESLDQSANRPEYSLGPGSPTHKSGKENTPPGVRQSKPSPNQAAVSRQELYQARDTDSGTKARYNPQRGLTSEELEKLQLPKVKRLTNVTQLCKTILH